MPQRTIAAGGGNWNSTSTWVEGAVPTASDFVVGNASSGQLTINVGATCQYVDFSAYTQTLTFNSQLAVSLGSSTNIFGASMSFAGTSAFVINAASSITQNTTNRIPNLFFNAAGTLTLNTDLYITNFSPGINAQTYNASVARTIRANGSLSGSSAQINMAANITFILDGTGTVNISFLNGAGQYRIDTAGTLTFAGNGLSFIDGANLRYVTGTLVTPIIRWITQGSATLTLNTSGVTWDSFVFTDISNAGTNSLALAENFNVSTFIIASDRGSSTETIQFTSTGRLNVTDRMILQCNTALAAGTLRLNTTGSHYIDKLFALSGSVSRYTFRSTTNGTKATLQLGDKNNSPIFYVNFTDINASSGQEIRTYAGTVSNSNNITSYTSTIFTTGGGGGGSFTFVN